MGVILRLTGIMAAVGGTLLAAGAFALDNPGNPAEHKTVVLCTVIGTLAAIGGLLVFAVGRMIPDLMGDRGEREAAKRHIARPPVQKSRTTEESSDWMGGLR